MLKFTMDTQAIRDGITDVVMDIGKAIKGVAPDIKDMLLAYAKTHHKFTSRSGTLQNKALKASVTYDKDSITINLYLDKVIAEYASFIVAGTRPSKHGQVKVGSGADPFLEKAITDNESKIISMIEQAISKVK